MIKPTPAVSKLSPYIPGKPIEELERELQIDSIIKLASNENPYGPSPKVKEKISQLLQNDSNNISNSDYLARYPDGSGFRLKKRLAQKLSTEDSTFEPEQITLGNGSNDVLDIICRCFARSGDEVIFSEYAFAVYPICTQAVGATAVIAKAKNWGHDLDAMTQAITDKTKLIFIANPNNPTGTCLTYDAIRDFLSQIPSHVVVVIDEAYCEYAEHQYSPWSETYQSTKKLLSHFSNLIITRTFSKAYGLASFRIGYSISSHEIANILNRVRQPFNNNSFALEVAIIALDDTQHLDKVIKNNWQQMSVLEQFFQQLNISYIPSAGNFICMDCSNFHLNNKPLSSIEIHDQLLLKGVIVRPIANYNMLDYLRISVGNKLENQLLKKEIKTILS